MIDARRFAQELRNLAAVVAREVRAHPGPEVGRLADVEHTPVAVAEQVDAGRAGQPGRERELRGRRVGPHRRQREEIVEPEHAERRGPFEQRVQHLGGCRRVGVRAVDGLDGRAEMLRERVQPEVRHFVADEPARDRDGVDPPVRHAVVAVRDERGVEERAVEADVVPDDHRVARELEECGEHLGDARRGQQHRLGDPGQHRDHRRDRHAGVHERLEPAEQLAAAQLQRADLGDRVGARRPAGGFEVDDDERDFGERRAEIVEGLLAFGVARARLRGDEHARTW